MSTPTNTLGNRHFHAWFMPGETYNHLGTRYYLGYMVEVGNRMVMTNTTLAFVGQSLPETGTAWSEYVGGKGHKITKRLPLTLESWMLDLSAGYVIPTGESDDIGGVQRQRIWIETTADLVSLGTTLHGKIITFFDGSMCKVAAANAVLEPGTVGMYKLWVTGTAIQGGAIIGIARRLPAEEMWWEGQMKTMIDVSCVGVLELAYGVRDTTTDTVPDEVQYCLQRYKCRITGLTSKASYGNMPFFSYDMAVELSDYDETTAETTVSDDFNLTASDKTYTDAILLTWDAIPNATRYQIYRSPKEADFDGFAGEDWQDLDDTYQLYTRESHATAPDLIAEVPASDWDSSTCCFKSLGLVDGADDPNGTYVNAKDNPADGSSAENRAYPSVGTALSVEQSHWYAIRALINKSNTPGDSVWTALSSPVCGTCAGVATTGFPE